jgi:hypothetical protein
LFEFNASAFGGTDILVPGNLQQAAVHRVGHGIFVG